MNRRQFLAAPLALSAQRAAAARPNILLIVADDLGWQDVGYHGGPAATPNIDRLARQGVELDRYYAFPVCSPTRSALLTGRSPMRYGVIYSVIRPWANDGLPLDEHLLPQTLKAAGYQTAMAGKWHLGHARVEHLPTSRGFDSFYGHVNGAIDYNTHEREGGVDWQRNGRSVREEGYSTELLAAEGVRVIRERDRSRPLFLYLPFNAPHAPLQAPAALIEKYAGIADKRRRVYTAMVDALDQGIGRVLAALDKEGIADNTLVVFQSDNGGPIQQGASNGSLRGAKGTTFEGGIRVPAVMRWPAGLGGGRKLTQVATVLDMLPTLAAAAGTVPGSTKPLDGRNLWPAIVEGRSEPREDLLFAVEDGQRTWLAVRRRQWKLVREIRRADRAATEYLFDIDNDPDEKTDLAAKQPQLVKELAARIREWQALHPPGGITASQAPHPGWIAPKDWAAAVLR